MLDFNHWTILIPSELANGKILANKWRYKGKLDQLRTKAYTKQSAEVGGISENIE